MFSSARRGWRSPACIVTALSFAVAMVAGPQVCGATTPLVIRQTLGPTCDGEEYDLAYKGKGIRATRGRARLALDIPGTPVAAYLYLVGSDDPATPGRRYPHGDDTVRAVVRSAAGRFVDNVPVAYQALDVFVNKLDITPYVAPGRNVVRIRGYGLNDRQGIFVMAVYGAPGLPPVRIDFFDGVDYGYYPLAPPFGPDSEVFASVYPAAGIPRDGQVWMVFGGMERRRGDEVLMRTGAGLPDLAELPDTDGDGLPDLLQRQYRLTRRDRRPLGNDPADRAGNLEALPGCVSLEEDQLGAGCTCGPQLAMFTHGFTLPAGDEYAAFQVQSEDPEFGDSFALVAAATRMPDECGNPRPDYILTKTASIDEGYPGDLVTYTFVVTNTGLEPLENIVVTDSVLGYIGTVAALGLGESATLTHVDYVLPVCDESIFTVLTRCDGVTIAEDRCSLPNTATATWHDQTRTAVDCVEIKKRGRIIVVKQTIPDGAPDHFPFTASYAPGSFQLADGETNDSGDLVPGTYSVAEQVPQGWTLISSVCANGAGAPEDPAAIVLEDRETVTCVFTNERETPGIEIVKTVDPAEAYPGDVVTYSFTVTNTGGVILHDVTVTDPTLSPAPLAVIPELAPGASATITREMAVPSCDDPRTEPGACTDGSSECAGAPAATFGLDTFLGLLDRTPECPQPQLCHLPNTATAVGEAEDGTVVTDDDDACLTILPFKLIGDLVWYDADQDGVRDAGEPGVADMPVILTLPNGDTVPFFTEAGGSYLMGGIRHGDYLVAPLVNEPGGVVTTANAPLPVRLEKCDFAYLEADFGYWGPGREVP